MPVLKRKRHASPSDVFHHWNKVRKHITEFLLVDFGYKPEKTEEKLKKLFTTDPDSTCVENNRRKLLEKYYSFEGWFILDERRVIVECLRKITELIYLADNTPITSHEEYIKRRMFQDEAIGQCYRLIQELQYAIETLPVNVNRFTQFSKEIQEGIEFIKDWRQSDNRFKGTL